LKFPAIAEKTANKYRGLLFCAALFRCGLLLPSSVVCQLIGLSVTLVSPAKTAEPIEILFGLRTWVGPGNHVLDGGPDPPWEGAILRVEVASHCKV